MILEESRQGPLTARINNRYIHSRYSPQKEADQFYMRWTLENRECRRIVLIEPGLGYLIKSITSNPTIHDLFVIFLSSETMKHCRKSGLLNKIQYQLFDPLCREMPSLSSFLQDSDIRKTAVLEWPAAMQAFNENARLLKQIIVKLFRIKQGNQITEQHFSRIWFNNGICNFIRYDYSYNAADNSSPVILCASGPSLDYHLDRIKKLSSTCIIASLPSSLRVLKEHGIETDILFSTDPGYYAREHLKYLPSRTLSVSPISAAADNKSNLMGFLQGSPVESYLFEKKELPRFPEMGTVAATAIDFLIRWKGKMPLYICGLDLCFDDIKMHASPHSFEPLILEKESRLNPGHSLTYERAYSMTDRIEKPYRFTKSMTTYQNWFSMQNFPADVYRIGPETVKLEIPILDSIPWYSKKKKFSLERNLNYPDFSMRKTRVRNLAETLKRDLDLYVKRSESTVFLSSLRRALSMDDVDYDTLSLMAAKWAGL